MRAGRHGMNTGAGNRPAGSREHRADEKVYEMQVRICKAFANATRLRMLDMLGAEEHSSSELQERLGITAANMSQHLAILKGAGIVTTRREGKQIYCSLAMSEVKGACEMVREVLRAQVRDSGRSMLMADESTAAPRSARPRAQTQRKRQ